MKGALDGIEAVIFDLDGVVTRTARVHARAWKETFDSLLARAAVVEDALAGVEAGCAGGFAEVIGVDRAGQAAALREHGATRVVRDLGELELAA